jgi:hypothetical protein
MAKNNKSRPIKPSKLSVYLYIPNIIGGFFFYSRFPCCCCLCYDVLLYGIFVFLVNIHSGYTRVLMNCYAFAICFSNKWLFCALYFIRWGFCVSWRVILVLSFDLIYISNIIGVFFFQCVKEMGVWFCVLWFQLCLWWYRWLGCSQIQSRHGLFFPGLLIVQYVNYKGRDSSMNANSLSNHTSWICVEQNFWIKFGTK